MPKGEPQGLALKAVVPYLRMSGRWLEEHGFAIGSGVQVVVEHGRVTLLSGRDERTDERPPAGSARRCTR